MKQIFLIIGIITISTIYTLSQQVPDTCLKLIWDINEKSNISHSFGGHFNPDSIKADSCIGSSTYGKLFAKRYFYLNFKINNFPFDYQLKPDSIKRVSDISNSKPELKAQFQQLESQFGTIYFQGFIYEQPDSDFWQNPGCRMTFELYQDIADVESVFASNIDSLRNIIYQERAMVLTALPNPSDLAFKFNLYYSDLNLDWKQDRDYSGHTWYDFFTANLFPYGYHSPLFELKCPLAWEISQGDLSIILSFRDFFDKPSEHPDIMPNFIRPFRGNGSMECLSLGTGHGLQVISDAIARGGNEYPMSGTAPKCKGVAITSDAFNYDMDGTAANNIIQYSDVQNCSFILGYINRSVIDSGIVVVAGAGNDRNGPGDILGANREFATMPDGSVEIRPTVVYPAATVYSDENNRNVPSLDYKVIGVAGAMSGVLQNKFCENWPETKIIPSKIQQVNPNYKMETQFTHIFNFSPGITKFDITTSPTDIDRTRIANKSNAFVDLVAPSMLILSAHEVNPLAGNCDNLFTVASIEWFRCKTGIPINRLNSMNDLDLIMQSGSSSDQEKINNAIHDARKYILASGTSMATPLVSGIVGLMLSVNKFMGVPLRLDGKPVNGEDVQRVVYNALTFTAKKIKDYENFPTEKFSWYNPNTRLNEVFYYSNSFPTGEGYQYDYKIQWNDNLKRTWAQRVGFGFVNAFRAVAHSIRQKGLYEYSLTGNYIIPFQFNDGAVPTSDSRGYVNPDGIRVMHWGSRVREGTGMFEIPITRGPNPTNDGILNVLEWGGVSLPGEYHNNQGVTKITNSANPDVRLSLTVPVSCILAIDGILFSEQPNACHVVRSVGSGSSMSKILMEGYLKDVEIYGNLRLGDLIIESSINNGIATIPGCVGFGTGAVSEIYGHLKTVNYGYIYSWGNVTAQPGTIISLDGTEDLELWGTSEFWLEHSSRIETSSDRKVIVQSNTKLIVDSNSVVELDLEVNVKSGGQFIIYDSSIVKLKKLNVEQGGKITIYPNATLALEDQEQICDGNFVAVGTETNKIRITGNLNEHCLPYDDPLYTDFVHIKTQPTIYMRGDCSKPDSTGLTISDVIFKDIAVNVYNSRIPIPIQRCEFLTNTKLTNPYFSFPYLLSLRYNNCEFCPSPFVSQVSLNSCRFKDLSQPKISINDPGNLNELEFRTGGMMVEGYKDVKIETTGFGNLEYGISTYDCDTVYIAKSRFDSCGIGNYDFASFNVMCNDTFRVVQYGTIRDHSLISKTYTCYYDTTRIAYRAESSLDQKLRDNIFNEYLQAISISNTKLKINDESVSGGWIIYGANIFNISPMPPNMAGYVNKFITRECERQLSADINLENSDCLVEMRCGGNKMSAFAAFHLRRDITDGGNIANTDISYNRFEPAPTFIPRTSNVPVFWEGQPSNTTLQLSRGFRDSMCCGDLYYENEFAICNWMTHGGSITCIPYDLDMHLSAIQNSTDYTSSDFLRTRISLINSNYSTKNIINDYKILKNLNSNVTDYRNYLKILESQSNKQINAFGKLLFDYNLDRINNLDDYSTPYHEYFQFLNNSRILSKNTDKFQSGSSLLDYTRLRSKDTCTQWLSGMESNNQFTEFGIINVLPNPLDESGIISFNLPKSAKISISVSDIQGLHSTPKVIDRYFNSGYNSLELSFKEFTPGLYIIIITDGINTYTKTFLINR